MSSYLSILFEFPIFFCQCLRRAKLYSLHFPHQLMILDHGDDLGLAIVQTVQTIEDVRVDLGSCTMGVLL